MILIASVVFFLSGAAALVFETLWFRQAGLALGNGVWASSIVLAAFMAGLAVGNAVAARRGEWLRSPLLVYAALEMVVAASGILLVFSWPAIGADLTPLFRRLVDVPPALNAARLAIAFLLMLVPASAMGMTLPVLTQAFGHEAGAFGRTLGWLYGANTLGAVAGALGAEIVLVGRFGVRGTAAIAAGMDVAAALGACILVAYGVGRHPPVVAAPPESRPIARRLMAAAFVCGATMLALEVVWFRFLSMFVLSSSRAFALLLAAVLIGIGAGGLLAAALLRASSTVGAYLKAILFVAGVCTVITYSHFELFGGLQAQTEDAGRILALTLWLTFPVTLLSGVSFTLLGHRAHPEGESEARTAGHLTLANTLGAMVGSLAGGFMLLPGLGMERSLAVLALTYGVAAALVSSAPGSRPARIAGAAGLVLFAAAVLLFPTGLMEHRYLPLVTGRFVGDGSRVVKVQEGLTETIVYMRRDQLLRPPVFRLVTNGFSMSATGTFAQRYMSIFVALPAALHAQIRRSLVISYGCGNTARALALLPGVEKIDVVDISRDILETSRILRPREEDPLADPRVEVHVEDGRQFLQISGRQYDLITGEPPPLRAAGVVNLYTREYFELMRARLAPGGLATYWVPVTQGVPADWRAVLGAFCDTFPDCSLWNGSPNNWILLGTNSFSERVSDHDFAGRWQDPVFGSLLRRIGVEQPVQMGALFLDDSSSLREWIGAAPPLVDDFPHRILHRVSPGRSWSDVVASYRRRMDAHAARRRFETSAFVTAIWPKTWRDGSLAQFEWQGILNDGLLANRVWRPPSTDGLAELDAVLARSSLRTLALWLQGSDVDEQEAASALAVRGQRHDEILGLGALADRRYADAAEMFSRAGGSANLCRAAYALALAGRQRDVELLARSRRFATCGEECAAFWTWMRARFGFPG